MTSMSLIGIIPERGAGHLVNSMHHAASSRPRSLLCAAHTSLINPLINGVDDHHTIRNLVHSHLEGSDFSGDP
jgi:hypothetical protein